LVYAVITEENLDLFGVGKYFIFAQNLFYDHPSWFFPEAWSLSIEEWFYLITPVCMFLAIGTFKIEPKKAILLVALLLLAASLFIRYYKYATVDITSYRVWDLTFRKQVFTRLDSLMFGVIGAYIQYYYRQQWLKNKHFFLFMGIPLFCLHKVLNQLGMYSTIGFYHCVLSFSINSIATLFLLPYLSDLKTGKGYIHKGLTVISLTSYSMYLINLSVVQGMIIDHIPWKGLIKNDHLMLFIRYGFFWMLTLVGSILIYTYFEIPTMKLRDNKRVKRFVENTLNK